MEYKPFFTYIIVFIIYMVVIGKYWDKWIVDGTMDKAENFIEKWVGKIGLLIVKIFIGLVIMVFLFWLPPYINILLGIN